MATKHKKKEIINEPVILNGKSIFNFSNGSKYEGEWISIDNVKYRHGFGIFIGNNEKYEGNWDNDNMDGYGEYTFASGAVYKGNFIKNLFNGEGLYIFPDGSKYQGQWENNKIHGEGEYTTSDNVKHIGTFVNGNYDTGSSIIPINQLNKLQIENKT
uniref:MORN repeat-containing protein 5 n=1 Tax=Chromulina nebulosa TaxID=96789 RepID=A0A7S0SWQ0_9STRA